MFRRFRASSRWRYAIATRMYASMLALPSKTQPSLPVLSSIARLLASERSFAARVTDLFTLLHDAVSFHDGRLLCWLQSAQANGPHEQFATPGGWPDPWNDDLTRKVIQRGSPVRLVVPQRVLLAGESPDLPGEITYFGAPITWGAQLWGVLELRAAGREAI